VGGTVREFMTEEVEVVDTTLDILQVSERLISGKRRRLPVVEDGKFVGQYSIRSILSAVKDFNPG
jgi:CBS domain-containing protein